MSSSQPPPANNRSSLPPDATVAAAAAASRQQAIVARLQELALQTTSSSTAPPQPSKKRVKLSDYKSSAAATTTSLASTAAAAVVVVPPPLVVPIVVEKTDTHWDYLLKEMQWLAADFTSERQRHRATSRKLAVGVRQHAERSAQRQWRQRHEAELQRRKRAARLGRLVQQQYWHKLERVVTYQQKQNLEEQRRRVMNQQLVRLVQQTERYTVTVQHDAKDIVQIEAALRQQPHYSYGRSSSSGTSRRTRVSDYAHLWRQQTRQDNAAVLWYGASTEESGSDATFSLQDNGSWSDDESTVRAAELEEAAERQTPQFTVNPVELQLLQEEAEMDVQQVLERLTSENQESLSGTTTNTRAATTAATRRVQFAVDAGSDADDDMDASDVEDFVSAQEDDNDGDDEDAEFEPKEADGVDDETTIVAEELLGRDMSPKEEIAMLNRENQMSLEELRAMYAGMEEAENDVDSVNDDDDDDITAGDDADTDKLRQGTEEGSSSAVEEDVSSTADEVSSTAGSEEFEPDDNVVDDETTMEAEEKLERDVTPEEEIAMLNRENELSVEQLRAMYADMTEDEIDEHMDDAAAMEDDDGGDSGLEFTEPSGLLGLLGEVEDQENDDDFQPDTGAVDDESTMEAEERLGREMSVEDEIALLKRENEMSVDELRALYDHRASDDAAPSREIRDDGSKRRRKEAKAQSDSDENGDVRSSNEKISAGVSYSINGDVDIGKVALDKLEASDESARKLYVSRPFLIPTWVKLREYQQIGLNWLVSLQSRRLNGILADEMGLGKTLQTIALLAYLAAYKGIWGPHLIVVPTSVMLNWETELKRFCPALKVLCYYGSAKRRKELRQGWTKSNWHHVVITSYQLVVQDSFAFKRKRWYYLVLDEAQHIKNFQSQRWQTLISFNTQRRLLLTGTPLQNNLMELWSLMHFLMPYIFRSRKEFSYWFANPLTSMIEGTSNQNDDVVRRLHGIIRPFVLRRLKKDVETQLPGKFEHILKCQLSRRQMFIYEEFMARSSTRQALRKGGNFMGMMNVLMQLRKVCNHPDLFEPRSIVTPFFVDLISVPIPSCVFGMRRSTSVFAKVGDYLLSPVWCGSRGEASIEASLRHDSIESDELLGLEASLPEPKIVCLADIGEDYPCVCPALRALAEEVLESQHQEACQNRTFLNRQNSRRCRAGRFPYPSLLLQAVSIPEPPLLRMTHDFMSTPSQLLALRRDQRERANDMSETIKKFVFAVPKAGARPPVADTCFVCNDEIPESTLNEILMKPVVQCLEPFRESNARLSSFFPDKKLVQFDAGKLQALAELLYERKRGGHKVLIFTQMSKMLDILEVFLNLNGHTYLRLDGGTNVDRRQRLMDRFNSDPKIFCFILSTRSGGVGINLTGADTVVFYDSDWNPAMDLQAQDRAHRIGQTREVHIYRLITEHTVEENILLKAKQKRNLDIMVMDRGNFDASQAQSDDNAGESSQIKELYTKGGLRAILGVSPDDDDDEGGRSADEIDSEKGKEVPLSSDQIEKTMTSLEDDDDVNALQGARQEAAEEFKEFDETVEYKKDSDAEDDEDEKNDKEVVFNPDNLEDAKNAEKELEKEIAAWQEKGMDSTAIESSLSPMERYGLRFKKDIDPFYSVYAVMEYNQNIEVQDVDKKIDIEAIERRKWDEEQRAFDDGDLLGTGPGPDDLIRQRNLYVREKARLIGNKKRRKLTGEDWEQRKDALGSLFWYNIDTGEALWKKPRVLVEMEEYELAYREGWQSMPMKNLVHIMEYLPSFPDKMTCARVSARWHKAATDISFVRHVYPVELGSYTRDERKIERNHYRSIADALVAASPGDSIELGDGHYWVTAGLVVNFPVRLIGDEHNPSNVVVETSGTIVWRAGGGFIEGITFRRPKLSSGEASCDELLRVEGNGRLGMVQSVFDNEGSSGDVVKLAGEGLKGRWESCLFQNGVRGITLCQRSRLEIAQCIISKNSDSGFVCKDEAELRIDACAVQKNENHGVALHDKSRVTVLRSRFLSNKGQLVKKESSGCSSTCSANICTKSVAVPVAPPGFQFNTK